MKTKLRDFKEYVSAFVKKASCRFEDSDNCQFKRLRIDGLPFLMITLPNTDERVFIGMVPRSNGTQVDSVTLSRAVDAYRYENELKGSVSVIRIIPDDYSEESVTELVESIWYGYINNPCRKNK